MDSGSDREIVGLDYAIRHQVPTKLLREPVRLRYMNGETGELITQVAYHKCTIEGTNGRRKFLIKYLVADIPEGFVLGLNWLKFANPIPDFREESLTWRENLGFETKEPMGSRILWARKARQRIIASEIASNEPPDWVKKNHPRVLVTKDVGLPPRRGVLDYQIKMKPGFIPRIEPARRFSNEQDQMFRALAEKEEAAGRWVVYPGINQAANMLMAAKAGGEQRPCTGYVYLNKWMEDDGYPIPNMRDLIEQVARSRIFSSVDLPKAYNHVRIADEASERLLSFHCAGKLYSPRVMQFGSKTAVAHYQRFIMHVLGDVIGHGCIAYLDNVVIHADTQEEHDKILDIVLSRLENNDLTIQPKKCEWSKEEVQFCGFMVGKDGIRLDPEKLKAISEWKPPAPEMSVALKKTKVREFVGFCNFYRDGMDHYSDIAEPLTTLTSPSAPWEWGTKQQNAFENLKTLAISAPVRAAFVFGRDTEIFTDASDKGTAAAIHQIGEDGKSRPVAFFSKKLNPAQQNYTVHDRELLAIVQTFEKFYTWLHGTKNPIKVWSDHSALKYWLDKTKRTGRTARWGEILGEFNFQIHHIPGRENRAADALSRKYETEEEPPPQAILAPHHFAGRACINWKSEAIGGYTGR
jgi:hypothetical protein